MSFEPSCLATAIGSLPHKDPAQAVKVVLENIPNAPIWPQLPANGLHEQMEIQYSEGMPRAVLDHEKGRMYFDTTGDTSTALAEFYEKFWPRTWKLFASPRTSRKAFMPWKRHSRLRASSVRS